MFVVLPNGINGKTWSGLQAKKTFDGWSLYLAAIWQVMQNKIHLKCNSISKERNYIPSSIMYLKNQVFIFILNSSAKQACR